MQQIIKQWGMEQCTPVSTPARPGVKLAPMQQSSSNSDSQRVREYQQLVGSLLYAAITTRADCHIMHAVAKLTRLSFMSNPGEEHWTAAWHMLRSYLAGSVGVRFHYRFRPDLHNSSSSSRAAPTSTAAGELQLTTLVTLCTVT